MIKFRFGSKRFCSREFIQGINLYFYIGCIGIQNTAIIIRALGLKLMKPGARPFFKFAGISFALSFVAAIIQGKYRLYIIQFIIWYRKSPSQARDFAFRTRFDPHPPFASTGNNNYK